MKQLARELYVSIMASATGLGNITQQQRADIFKAAAEICIEAAQVYESVEKQHTECALDKKV